MVSAQQMKLLPENASQTGTIFAQKSILDICNLLAILKFLWLNNHCSILYIHRSIESSAHYIGIIKYIQYIYKLAYIVKCGSAHSGVRHTTVSKDPTGVWKTIQQRYQFMYCIQ